MLCCELQHDSVEVRTESLRALLQLSQTKQLHAKFKFTSGLQGLVDVIERERTDSVGPETTDMIVEGSSMALAIQLLIELIEQDPMVFALLKDHSAVQGLPWSKLLPHVDLPGQVP